ncbi:helix-turn-helix domain-containing protein [Algihabitans albus]|uniref:helix-turn-helix domain-containing protein n=1 Tax=Algihabitans albus TaxID=2164067 RepID=UPI000E5D173A|nr:helix-turn-helix domain-containing protein [Algihabitans albus]
MTERLTRSTRVLRALPDQGRCVTVPDLAEELTMPRKEVSKALVVLHERGLAKRQRPGCYLVTEAGMLARRNGEAIASGPRSAHTGRRNANAQPTLRDKAWRAMRSLDKFTLGDLIELTGGGGRDPESNLRRYLRGLKAAGYLAELRFREPGTAPSSPGAKRYRLIKNSGPLPPRISQKRDDLYDPNTGESHPLTGGSAS